LDLLRLLLGVRLLDRLLLLGEALEKEPLVAVLLDLPLEFRQLVVALLDLHSVELHGFFKRLHSALYVLHYLAIIRKGRYACANVKRKTISGSKLIFKGVYRVEIIEILKSKYMREKDKKIINLRYFFLEYLDNN